MAERLVDVLDRRGSKIHTYPINLEDPAATDADFRAKALEAAEPDVEEWQQGEYMKFVPVPHVAAWM